MVIDQYDIVLVNLDPTIGSEIRKTRPCVIISPNELNKHLKTVVVAPMTSIGKLYPTRVAIEHSGKSGWIVIDQIRSIDQTRIVKHLGRLKPKVILDLKMKLKEIFID
jgi:mRNA interferase MazF